MKASLLSSTFLLVVTAGLVANTTAKAAATVAGSNINNSATVNYSVGGTPQTQVTSNTATFVVDRKVNLTVTEVGGAATVIAYGGTAQVTTFQVTNLTNATQDFRLLPAQQLTLSVGLLGLTDNMDMGTAHVYVDANANGTYEAGTDTATYIDELAPDLSKTVFIVADAPASGPSSGVAGVALTAITAAGGSAGTLGADVAATVGADTPGSIDVVFADGAGSIDALRDGVFSAVDDYITATGSVSFAKTAALISDPINGSLAPKAIPGAVVEYCLQVTNMGATSATSISIADNIPANTTYVASSLTVGGSVLLGACLSDGTAEDDNATGADETDLNGGSSNGTTVLATIPTITAGSTQTARFRVTLD